MNSSNTSQQLAAPKLTVLDAIAQSLAIGPVLSAGLLAGLVAGAAGSAAPLATLLGAIGSICVGWVIVLFARQYTGAGAIYDYVRRSAGATLGLFTAGIYFIGAMFLGGAGIFLAIGFFANLAFSSYLGINLPWWVWSLVAIAIVFAANHFGIQTATRTQLILTALAVLPVIIIALAIIFSGGANGNTLEVFNPGNPNAGNLFKGVLFAVTLFIGFEASAIFKRRNRQPQKDRAFCRDWHSFNRRRVLRDRALRQRNWFWRGQSCRLDQRPITTRHAGHKIRRRLDCPLD